MKDFEVTLRLRNNQLKARRVELGLTSKEFAERVRTSLETYSALENLRLDPRRKDGDWRAVVKRISEFHGIGPDELFPPSVRQVTRSVVSREFNTEELTAVLQSNIPAALPSPEERAERNELGAEIRLLLSTLTERQQAVLKARFGLDDEEPCTLVDIGKRHGLSRETVRQIEAVALNSLRRRPSIRRSEEVGTDWCERRASGAAIPSSPTMTGLWGLRAAYPRHVDVAKEVLADLMPRLLGNKND